MGRAAAVGVRGLCWGYWEFWDFWECWDYWECWECWECWDYWECWECWDYWDYWEGLGLFLGDFQVVAVVVGERLDADLAHPVNQHEQVGSFIIAGIRKVQRHHKL